MTWQTVALSDHLDLLAPDGSEIRLLTRVRGASVVHCTLAAGQVTRAVRHQTVEEVWFCLAGAGQVWRRAAAGEETVEFRPGMCLTIPLGVDFQFRATGDEPLQFIIATVPPWPGDQEAAPVEGAWQPQA